jgi:uncharacterized protein (TIGR04255 family)
MAAPRPLRRPPITEALIDLRTANDATIDANRLQGLRELLSEDYPRVEERRQMQAQLLVQEGGTLLPSTQDLGFHGLFFFGADGRRIAQFRRDGFTLNQLPPYSDADTMIREALRLWTLYQQAAAPPSITRVAFRYINVLPLPYGHGDNFRRFLTTPPDVPPEAPQNVSGFLSRIVAHEEDNTVILTHKMEASTAGETTLVTLDVDVFRDGELPPDGADLEGVLRRLRELKNRVFFASLTEEAVELFA